MWSVAVFFTCHAVGGDAIGPTASPRRRSASGPGRVPGRTRAESCPRQLGGRAGPIGKEPKPATVRNHFSAPSGVLKGGTYIAAQAVVINVRRVKE